MVLPTNPLADQLKDLSATVAEMKAQRVTYMAGTVTAVNNANVTFAADVLQPDSTSTNIAGIRTTAQFMPSIGTVVTLALSGPQIIYMPFGVANGSIDTPQLAPAVSSGVATAATKITTFYQPAPAPTGVTVGDLWIDTGNGNRLSRWTGSAWVLVQDAQMQTALVNAGTAQATADRKIQTFFRTTAPVNPADQLGVGDFWVDTGNGNRLSRWSGSAWVLVQDTAIQTALTNAQTAQTAANNAQTAANNAQTSANTALTTANGKNKVTYSTLVASGSGSATGDLWFQVDGTGVVIASFAWTGSAWVAHNFGDAVLNSLTAGKITAGTMSAAVTISGRFATALTGARVELNSAGLQKFDASSNQLVSITGASNLFTGQIQTALTGQRLVINPGSAAPSRIDFYPSTGSVFASIEAATVSGQGAVTMSATNGSTTASSGVLLVRPSFASMSFGTNTQSTVTTEIYTDVGTARTRAAVVDLQANGNASTAGSTRLSLGVNYVTDCWVNFWSSIFNEPMFSAPNHNCGIVFSSNVPAGAAQRMFITGGGGTAVNDRNDLSCGSVIYTGTLTGPSSREIKANIKTVTDVDIRAEARGARTVRFTKPLLARAERRTDDGRLIAPAIDAPVQVGLIAEEVPKAAQIMIYRAIGDLDVLGIDYTALMALSWTGLGHAFDDLAALEQRIAALETKGKP